MTFSNDHMLLPSSARSMMRISLFSCRYPCVPGIYSQEQTNAWKPIVEVQPTHSLPLRHNPPPQMRTFPDYIMVHEPDRCLHRGFTIKAASSSCSSGMWAAPPIQVLSSASPPTVFDPAMESIINSACLKSVLSPSPDCDGKSLTS